MATYVKITIKGWDTHKQLNANELMLIPERVFKKWFKIEYNRNNAPYHVFQGKNRHDITQFLSDWENGLGLTSLEEL